jgi:putative SOS response-associated peptidase YedK
MRRDGIKAFSIITTAARAPVKAVHDRMPVILRREEEPLWLSGKVALSGCEKLSGRTMSGSSR